MTDEVEITAEEIAQHYSAAMDSVNLINAGQPEEGCELPDAGASARRRRRLRSSLNKPNYRLPQLLPKSRAARQNRPCPPAATED